MKRKDGKKRNHPGNAKNLKPWPKGVSGNPAGRKNGGAYLSELLNSYLCGDVTEPQIRKIINDVKVPIPRRAAARRCLLLIENPDMADFATLIDGVETLEEVRSRGIDTSQIRKLKHKAFTTEDGTTEKSCEIELHDRSGENFDRICDRTNGRPRQELEVNTDGNLELRTADSRADAAAAMLNRLESVLSNA